MSNHQYIERQTGCVRREKLFCDWLIRGLYGGAREHGPWLFRTLTGARTSSALAFLKYDAPLTGAFRRFVRASGVAFDECLDPQGVAGSARRFFERQIRYWECRPMPESEDVVVACADARVVVGSLADSSLLVLKEKFFSMPELLGEHTVWGRGSRFVDGDFAVFRLTPDKYHYNHVPVSGVVRDVYEIDGVYHSCNPSAIVNVATPFSKNRRLVTIIDTDVEGGTGVGLVAMVEIVALMVGDIAHRYSEERYEDPRPVRPAMMVRRGCPKSLFRPGSSTDVLLFEPGRVVFEWDLVRNQQREGVESRFSVGFGRPLVETDVAVRSAIARRRVGMDSTAGGGSQ